MRHNICRKIIIMLLISAMLTSCGKNKPNDVTNDDPYKDGNVNDAGYEDWLKGNGDSNNSETTVITPEDNGGKSEALSFSPCEGVYIEAPANSLYEGTVLKMEPVEGKDEKIAEISQELTDNSYLMLKVWDMDAGLGPDDTLPGYLDMTIDLDKTGIDPSLYPYLTFFRVDENDNMMEYDVKIEGNKANFQTNQNSNILLAVGIGLMLGIPYYMYLKRDENKEANKYFKDRNMKTLEFEGSNSFGSYVIKYFIEDIEPKLTEKYYRMAQIEVECFNDAYSDYLKVGGKEIEDKNATVKEICENNVRLAELFAKKLVSNKELNELKKSIEDPEIITYTKKCIDIAYAYLAVQTQVHLPLYKVEFKCQKDAGPLGEAMNRKFSQRYIILRLSSIVSGSKEARDDFLLTVTHELFHLCQNRYRSIGYNVFGTVVDTDLAKFDEIGAPIVERDAFEYYRSKGYITTNPSLTPIDYWGYLSIPMNLDYDDKNIQVRHGYNLSDFVEYLMKATGKNITGKTLMDLRPYFTKPDISDVIRKAFSLTQAQLGEYWEEYITANKEKLDEKWFGLKATTDLIPGHKLNPGDQINVKLKYDGNYKMVMRGFSQENTKQEMPYLVLFDSWYNQAFKLLMTDEYVEIPEGYYVYGFPIRNMDDKHHVILEIYKYFQYSGGVPEGYTVYAFDKSEKPKLSQNFAEISIERPKVKNEKANAVIDGFEIKAVFPDGKVIKRECANDSDTKPVRILKNEIAELLFGKEGKKENVTVTVTVCEYVEDHLGKRYYGVESDPSEITVEFEEEEEETGEDTSEEVSSPEETTSGLMSLYYDGFMAMDFQNIKDLNPDYTTWSGIPGGNYYNLSDDGKIYIRVADAEYHYSFDFDDGTTRYEYLRTGVDIYGSIYPGDIGSTRYMMGTIDKISENIFYKEKYEQTYKGKTETKSKSLVIRDIDKEKSYYEIFMEDGRPVKVVVMLYYTADRSFGDQFDETYESDASVVFGIDFWN